MLTHKIIKTISVNLGVNYYQFKGSVLFGLEECASALATLTKLKMIDLNG